MSFLRSLCLLAALIVATGCSGTDVINTLSPSSHYDKHADLRFAAGPRGTLDLYSPRDAASDSPLVIFIYGGGWKEGDKADYEFIASSLTKKGYRVALPNYRLFPEVEFPAFVDDTAAAVTFLWEHLDETGGRPRRLFLMGHSAGAHIAALLATDESYLEGSDISVAGFVGLSGPYDFLPIESGYLLDTFPEDRREASQPINFVSPDDPPSLLLHGGDDDVVEPANSRSLHDRLAAAGVPSTLKVYDGKGHAILAAELAPPLGFLGVALEDVVAFLDSYTQ